MSMVQVLKLKPAFSDEALATKADLDALQIAIRGSIEALRIAGQTDIEHLDVRLTAEIGKPRLEVRRDLKGTAARPISWVIGQGAAVIAILFALLHFVAK